MSAPRPRKTKTAPRPSGTHRDGFGRFQTKQSSKSADSTDTDARARGKTKPGSRSNEIARVVQSAVIAAGRGLTVSEHRDAFAAATKHEAPESYDAEFHSLRRRGVLVLAGGRCGRTRYTHRDAPVPDGNESDDAMLVLQALRSVCTRCGRAVTTREVSAEARALGLVLLSDDPNVVRSSLGTLARRTTRGPVERREPLVVRDTETSLTGRPSARWRPIELLVESALQLPPRSRAEAVRATVVEARRSLARPASRREMRWWAEAHGADSLTAASLDPRRLGADLASTVHTDASHSGEPGRVYVLESDVACTGGAAVRYATGPLTAEESVAARIEDVVSAFRPADELEQVRVLERQAARLASPALAEFCALRRQTAASAVSRALGVGDVEAEVLTCSLRIASFALDTLTEWIEAAPCSDDVRAGRRAEIVDRRRQLRAIPAILNAPVGACEASVGIVGSCSLCDHDDLRPFLSAAARDLEASPGRRFGDRLLQHVRRLPSIEMREGRGGERFTRSSGTAPAMARMDRVDALLSIFDASPSPRTAALLASARNLTGRILRNRAAILRLLQEVTPPAVQRAAIVALGLLGSTDPGRYQPTAARAADPLDVAAVLLNAVLVAPQSAAEVATRLELTLDGRVASIAATTRIRCELGRYLTAVG